MAKETTFEHPPKGHVGMLGYDSVDDDFPTLLVDSDGHLQIDVLTSGLPTGGATEATLADCKTALELIDDLCNALDSVGTDEIDVNVEGYDPVPSSPICELGLNVTAGNMSWVAIKTYTVTTGKTFYLTDFHLADASAAAGVEFIYRLLVDGNSKIRGRTAAGHDVGEHLTTPVKATSGVVVSLDAYQWSGGNKDFHGSIIGFEV